MARPRKPATKKAAPKAAAAKAKPTVTEEPAAGPLRAAVHAGEFAAALTIAAKAASRRYTVQALGGVHVQSVDGRTLELSCTDMDVSVRTLVGADVRGPGRLLVNAKQLLETMKTLDCATSISLKDETVTVSQGASTIELPAYAAGDFPLLPVVPDTPTFTIPTASLARVFGFVSVSYSSDQSRPVLTGVLLDLADRKLVLAATDSYRLSADETIVDTDATAQVIVPGANIQLALRLLKKNPMIDVTVHDGNHVTFAAGPTRITSRKIDGQFPAWQQLIPDAFESVLEFETAPLIKTLTRIDKLGTRNAPVRLSYDNETGTLRIRINVQDGASIDETTPCKSVGTSIPVQNVEFGYNTGFLLQGIQAFQTPTLRMKIINPLRPALLTNEQDNQCYLIMPIRLAG